VTLLLVLGALLVLVPVVARAFLTVDVGAGAGWFDCNNDGYLDTCILTPDGYIMIMIYDPAQGKFVDKSSIAIPVAMQGVSAAMGVACGDVNNDGWNDLYLTFLGLNALLLNNGDDTFTPVTRKAGVGGGTDVHSSSAAFIDYDNDGDLDIYVASYGSTPDIGYPDQLYRNDGVDVDGVPHFVDMAPLLHMDQPQNGESKWGLGVATADYDNDGDMDIYVADDYDGTNLNDGSLNPGIGILYRNEGDGTFSDVTFQAGVGDSGWSMGAAWGDYNQDGWMDLYVANFWEDVLYRNNGDGTFTDVTAAAGLPTVRPDPAAPPPCTVCNGWGVSFIDYDNDGDLDIHVANGYIGNSEGQDIDEADDLWENIGRGTNGEVQFRQVAGPAGVANTGDSRGSAYADVNRDGFPDILVINNNFISGGGTSLVPKRILYVNQRNGTFRDMTQSYGLRDTPPDADPLPPRMDLSQNHWIDVFPVGTVSNRNAIGSRITVQAAGKTWIQDVGTGSYLSTNTPYIHFGLGPAASIDRVTVRFPHGGVATVENPPRDAILTVSENQATPVRLLSFGIEAVPDGARIGWRYADDGDVAAFTVSRGTTPGDLRVLAPFLVPTAGWGEYIDGQVPRGIRVLYALDALYRDGSHERLATAPFFLPAVRAVGRNFPNPFRGATAIPVEGPPGRRAVLEIFDVSGRRVRALEGTFAEGRGVLTWDGRDETGRTVPAGVYTYRLQGSGEARTMIRSR
jgi:hypothetical protein